MKRLLIALAAAVAVSTASAIITDTQLFETSFDDFVADVQGEDSSALTAYESGTQPSFTAPYPCGSYGDNFLKLDTGDATLWRTNTSAAADIYFDMAIQFTPTAAGDEPDPTGNKIVVFMDAETNIVVISGTDAIDHTPVTNSFPAADYNLAAKSWARLTIAAVQDNDALRFNVLVNETPLQRSFFYSLDGDTLVREVGLSGSGAVDDFVARTTNPFLENPAVTIDGEGYDSIAEAIADNPTATPQLEDDISYSLARGESVSVKLNNHTLDLTVPAGLYAYSTTSDGVTTYSVDYFPRTNTAGQDGSAAHPYEIADNDDLLALQAAVLADAATFASKSYIQTANIDMTGVEGFYGIGWFKSSTAYLSLPEGVTLSADGKSTTDLPFTGVYDGAGYTISNVTLVRHSYAGVFNCVAGTVTNLTVQNIGINDTTTAGEHGDLEWGCAIVGNAQGSALLENLTSAGTVWGNTPNHNTAGIVVRAQANTTIRGCVNNVALSTTSKRLGGILSFTGTSGTVRIQNCTNNAALVSTDGTRGVGGILGSPESGAASTVVISGCADLGSETAGASGYTGAIVGSLWNGETNNYTDDGGNTYPAASDICGFLNGKTVAGLAYAIDAGIDGANYLTTVAATDLAAGNTYTLLADIAASETPVFTLAEASDTIAFDTAKGFTFAGTVAVDRTKLMPATSETVGTVTTYSTAAGVASVDGVAYATFEDAVAALEGETTDDFVTLLADVTTEITAGTTLKVKTGTHTFTPVVADDVILASTTDENDVMTFTATAGIAAVSTNGVAWTWYATFADAFAAAYVYEDNSCDMKVKVGADWTLPSVAGSVWLYSLTFIATTDEAIEINLSNGSQFISSKSLTFPANATLHIVSGKIDSISGGTLDIPAGVTVTLPEGSSGTLANISGLVGAGTLVAPTNTGALNNFIASEKYSGWLKAATWTGTLQCSGDSKGTTFANIANANASIRFSGFTNYVSNATSASGFGAIELVGDGLALAGEYSSEGAYTFTNALKGDGALTIAVTGGGYGNGLKTIQFTGDVSGFGGSITFADGATYKAHDVLIFGSDSSTASNAVVVSAGVVMTNATGKTWNVPGGVVVNGNLVANGTVTTAAELDGSGIYEVNASTAAIKVADTWTGTYNANFKAANNAIFYVPVNASATTVINGANGEFGGYPNFGGAAPAIAGDVVLNANWTIANGWAGAGNVTTFAKLSGSGNLTVDGTTSGTDPIYYTITELDDYAGTLGGARGSFTIGHVNVAEQPTNGACVVKTAIGANGTVNDNVPLWVAGSDTTKTLAYDANGAYGAGLYYIDGTPTPVVPEVTPSASGTVDCGSAAAAAVAADAINAAKATYIKAPEAASLSSEAAADYADLFTARAEGTSVVVELSEAGTNALETAATNVAAQVAADLSTVAATASATSVSITGAQPGFYYSVVYSADLSTLESAGVEGDRAVAGSDGAVTLPIPAKSSNATAGFYRVLVNVGPKVTP